jgi:hypothetical protein
MLIAYLLKPVDLLVRKEQRGGNAVNGCVAPPLIVESSGFVQVLEECTIGGRPEEVHVCYLKV